MRARCSSLKNLKQKEKNLLTTDNQKILHKQINGQLNNLRHQLQKSQGKTNHLPQYQ